VVRRKEPLRLPDIAASPDFRGLPPHHPPMGPFLGVPILDGDASVGHLYLSRRPGRESFDDQDERVVRTLATFAAAAMANARLHRKALVAIRLREETLSVVSHDLKNPLLVVQMSAERVRDLSTDGFDRDEVRAASERIARAAERMGRLINDLLDLTLVESGAMRVKRMPEVVEVLVKDAVDLAAPLARQKSIDLHPEIEPAPPVVCENDLIARVFWNLISNAIKFTPPGGSIRVGAQPFGSDVRFSVADNGAGISEEHLPHVFERFWQEEADRRGTGLGLYISKGIVEAHGGRIGVESQIGVGTTIWFTLPVQDTGARVPVPSSA
jgi:signal transduction histidine kinase